MPSDAELARKLFSGPCEFVAGATALETLPDTPLPEVAFVGRSNVGKSSLINALVNRISLARVSQTPGRTRQINMFRIRDSLMLTDLPGYGFARVSKSEAASWNALIAGYLQQRRSLRRVVLLIDARRGLMDSDRQVLSLLSQSAVPTQFVLTKADLLKRPELEQVQDAVSKEAARCPVTLAQVVVTAATSQAGMPELRAALAELAVH